MTAPLATTLPIRPFSLPVMREARVESAQVCFYNDDVMIMMMIMEMIMIMIMIESPCHEGGPSGICLGVTTDYHGQQIIMIIMIITIIIMVMIMSILTILITMICQETSLPSGDLCQWLTLCLSQKIYLLASESNDDHHEVNEI